MAMPEAALIREQIHNSHHIEKCVPGMVGYSLLVAISGEFLFCKDDIGMLGGALVGVAITNENNYIIGFCPSNHCISLAGGAEAIA
jgi:hypothetical protein